MTTQTKNYKARLILVDGLAGSGKSTAAQRLWLHFMSHGYDASWFHEHQLDHPIFFYDDVDELLRLQPDAFEDRIVASWDQFARDADAQPIRILEGSFFQITVGVMLSMNVRAQRIRKALFQIARMVNRLNPCLIYLFHQDTREGVLRIRNHRGDYWLNGMTRLLAQSPYGRQHRVQDVEGLVQFYGKQRLIVDSVFSRLTFKKQAIDISGGRWASYYRRMAALLKIGKLKPLDLPERQLMRCVGTYKGRTTGSECVISTDANSLYFHRSGAEAEKLMPVGTGTFSLRGLPIDLRFAYDGGGIARSMTFDTKLSDRRITDTVWTRILRERLRQRANL